LDRTAGCRAAGEIAHRNGHRLGDKGVIDFDVVRSGAAQSRRVPGVDDLVNRSFGSRKIRYSMPSASSSEDTTLASMFHALESTPDENGQLPRSR